MNKILIACALVLLGSCISINAQTTTESKQVRSFNSPQEEIAHLVDYKKALITKRDYINSRDEERVKAEASGWFLFVEDMLNQTNNRLLELGYKDE